MNKMLIKTSNIILTFLNLEFSLARASSSSEYVRTPILISMTQGFSKSAKRSASSTYAYFIKEIRWVFFLILV